MRRSYYQTLAALICCTFRPTSFSSVKRRVKGERRYDGLLGALAASARRRAEEGQVRRQLQPGTVHTHTRTPHTTRHTPHHTPHTTSTASLSLRRLPIYLFECVASRRAVRMPLVYTIGCCGRAPLGVRVDERVRVGEREARKGGGVGWPWVTRHWVEIRSST